MEDYAVKDPCQRPKKAQEDKFHLWRAMLRCLDRGLTQGWISMPVWLPPAPILQHHPLCRYRSEGTLLTAIRRRASRLLGYQPHRILQPYLPGLLCQ